MKEKLLDSSCRANEVALNPSLLPHGNGYLLATRLDAIDPCHCNVAMKAEVWQYWGRDRIRLDETDKEFQPTGRCLELTDAQDPRLFRVGSAVWMAFCRAWKQWVVAVNFNHHFERWGEPLTPHYEQNAYLMGRADKNWTWIDGTKDTLDCIYLWQPFTVARFDENGCCLERWQNPHLDLSWPWGRIDGGSPSVLLPSGERFSVFHSHLGEPRTYYMGGIYHEPEWPYRPIRLLGQPLLCGTQRFTRWPLMETSQRCAVVFPCGLVAEPNRLLVSYGVDDCQCAIAEFNYNELNEYANHP